MSSIAFGHKVERDVREQEVWYQCVKCGLSGRYMSEFERYGCPPQ